jgi:hypothetical protein
MAAHTVAAAKIAATTIAAVVAGLSEPFDDDTLVELMFGEAEFAAFVGDACKEVDVDIVAATATVAVAVKSEFVGDVKVNIVVTGVTECSIVVVAAERAPCVCEDSALRGSNGFANGFSFSPESSSFPKSSSSLSSPLSSSVSSSSPPKISAGGMVLPLGIVGGTGEGGIPS